MSCLSFVICHRIACLVHYCAQVVGRLLVSFWQALCVRQQLLRQAVWACTSGIVEWRRVLQTQPRLHALYSVEVPAAPVANTCTCEACAHTQCCVWVTRHMTVMLPWLHRCPLCRILCCMHTAELLAAVVAVLLSFQLSASLWCRLALLADRICTKSSVPQYCCTFVVNCLERGVSVMHTVCIVCACCRWWLHVLHLPHYACGAAPRCNTLLWSDSDTSVVTTDQIIELPRMMHGVPARSPCWSCISLV